MADRRHAVANSDPLLPATGVAVGRTLHASTARWVEVKSLGELSCNLLPGITEVDQPFTLTLTTCDSEVDGGAYQAERGAARARRDDTLSRTEYFALRLPASLVAHDPLETVQLLREAFGRLG